MTATLPDRPGEAGARRRSVRRMIARWRPSTWLATALALVLALVGTVIVVMRHQATTCPTPVAARALSDLNTFVRWLDVNDARGYVGEVGWPSGPDAQAWNQVASDWFDRADGAGLWVTIWAAGRWWPSSYRMAVYRLSGRAGTPPVAGPQASVAAAHFQVPGSLRGVALPSGSFGSGRDGPESYSNARPGRPDRDYYYEDGADYTSLAHLGVQLVRLAFTWERVQPRPDGPLASAEIRRIGSSVAQAHAAGLAVVLDLHNYGDYYVATGRGGHRRLVLGSPQLPTSALADLWGRLARTFRGTPGVLGYGLMNEPTGLAASVRSGTRVWERASQQAVDAIRRQHDSHTVLVSGYDGSSPGTWPQLQPRAWIVDPDHSVRYEAHQYFDATRSGGYSQSYVAETAAAQKAGYGRACAGSTTSGAAAPVQEATSAPVPDSRYLR